MVQRSRNPLYIMAKPPPEVAAQVASLSRNDQRRGPELLHVTLLSLFDLAVAPGDWLTVAITALDAFEGSPFPLSFDRIEERRAVTLRTRDPLPEARALQAGLLRFLLERRVPLMLGTTPIPHLTINYRGDGQGARKITPIGWTVTEILLVESVLGQTRHVEHGCWALTS